MIFLPHLDDSRVTDFIREWVSPDNICLQSEDLSTTWMNRDSTEETNTQIALDGLLTADTFTNTHASNTGYMEQNFVSTTVAYTYSHYLKAGTSSDIQLGIVDQGTVEVTAIFDLLACTVLEGAGSPDSFGIKDVGNGWFRGHVTHTFTTAGAADTIRLGNDGINGSTAHAWGAQLELGSRTTRYSPTTTVATKIYPFGNINELFKKACGQALNYTDAQIAEKSIDDIWKDYLITIKGFTFIGNHVNHYGVEADFSLLLT